MTTSQQVRQQFLDFFVSKGHTLVDSSPVVPLRDPTLMFANAGMNQFKDVFLGTGSRSYKRAANTQKCIRAGGKHNDLDDVGRDTYHHTFFEMLGNWSFGDYFKNEAIAWAWELLTEVWGIDGSRLHATYFGGSQEDRLEPDTEAAELWKSETNIDPTHIHPGHKKDNFWEMGDTGPCGPCSEIHIDLTPDRSGASLVNKDDSRVIELWNLVFIQFNRAGDGKLTPLPARHVDTGMGFERITAVLQGEASNYDTDVFTPIFEAIQKRTGALPYGGTLLSDLPAPISATTSEPQASACADARSLGTDTNVVDPRGLKLAAREELDPADDDQPNRDRKGADLDAPTRDQVMIDVSYRVIADHLRCLTFALTDGAIPSNEGRGYVLRRILRRAVRYGRQYLNMHEPFLADLVPGFVELMGDAFPELRIANAGKNVEHVVEMIRDEEASFGRTLEQALRTWWSYAGRALWDQVIEENLHWQGSEDEISLSPVSSKNVPLFDRDPEPMHAETSITIRRGATKVLARFKLKEVRPEHVRIACEKAPMISGEAAFKLHDTYGFPIDLTEQMADEHGLTINLAEYERLMEAAREKARATGKKQAGIVRLPEQYATDDSYKYETLETEAKLVATQVQSVDGDFGLEPPVLRQGGAGHLYLNRTCFYGEQGGQVGDVGLIEGANWRFRVTDTLKGENTVAHVGIVERGEIATASGDDDPIAVTARVDPAHRIPTMQNHTSTHMLNWALREVLGDRVQQKGSLVDPDKTRFDLSHNKPITHEELTRIEQLVNEMIDKDLPVYTEVVDQKKALEIDTLRAVFGEKYPDRVRVVSVGAPIGEAGNDDADTLLGNPKDPKWMGYTVEFCGGTHLARSGEAERFVLISEEGVAKGVRRVVGITGEAARRAEETATALLSEVAMLERQSSRGLEPERTPDDLGVGIAEFQNRVTEAVVPIRVRNELRERIVPLQKLARQRQKQSASATGDAVMDRVEGLLRDGTPVDGVTIVVGDVPTAATEALRGAIDRVRNKTDASAVLLVTSTDDKVTLVAGMSKDVVAKGVKAGDLIREVAPLVGGRGGGRPDMAQGGGNDPDGIPAVLGRARAWITEKLSGV